MQDFWDFFWLIISFFLLMAYLILLFQIIGDLLRDRALGGWAKAVWVLALIVVPLATSLVYVIARGKGMAERSAASMRSAQADADEYIRSVAGTASPTDEIARAKALLDSGAINAAEFDQLKTKALA